MCSKAKPISADTEGMIVVGGLVVCSAGLAYRLYRLVCRRQPRFEVGDVSEYWLQQQRDTSGDTNR